MCASLRTSWNGLPFSQPMSIFVRKISLFPEAAQPELRREKSEALFHYGNLKVNTLRDCSITQGGTRILRQKFSASASKRCIPRFNRITSQKNKVHNSRRVNPHAPLLVDRF